jgi:hypothetical protein
MRPASVVVVVVVVVVVEEAETGSVASYWASFDVRSAGRAVLKRTAG